MAIEVDKYKNAVAQLVAPSSKLENPFDILINCSRRKQKKIKFIKDLKYRIFEKSRSLHLSNNTLQMRR